MPVSPLIQRLESIQFAKIFEERAAKRERKLPEYRHIAPSYFASTGATEERYDGVHELRFCDAVLLRMGMDPDLVSFMSYVKLPSGYFWNVFFLLGGKDPFSADPINPPAHPILVFVSVLNRLRPYVYQGQFGQFQYPRPVAEWIVERQKVSAFLDRNPIPVIMCSGEEFSALRGRGSSLNAEHETDRMRNFKAVHEYCFKTVQAGGTYDPRDPETWMNPRKVASEVFGLSEEEANAIAYECRDGKPGRKKYAAFSTDLARKPTPIP